MGSLFLDELGGVAGNELSTLFHAALDDGELSTREIARLDSAIQDDKGLKPSDRTKLRDLFDAIRHA